MHDHGVLVVLLRVNLTLDLANRWLPDRWPEGPVLYFEILFIILALNLTRSSSANIRAQSVSSNPAPEVLVGAFLLCRVSIQLGPS